MQEAETLYKKVYANIREAIVTKKYAPGEALTESALVKELGVSRTPIREALRLLEKENLVRIYPRRGAFVNSISLDNLREIFEIREILEGEVACRVAAYISIPELEQIGQKLILIRQEYKDKSRLSETAIKQAMEIGHELHHLLFVKFGNKTLLRIIDSLEAEQKGGCSLATHGSDKNVIKFLEQHLEIIRL